MNYRNTVAFSLAATCILTPVQAVLAGNSIEGPATVYAEAFQGKKTASGEKYDKNALTASSNKFSLGSMVEVTNKKTGKSVIVKINDIEGKHNKNILDLSGAAAAKIGLGTTGVVDAKVVETQKK
jgi:rare lipoprotein A